MLASDPVLWPWLPTNLCDAVQTGAWIMPDTRPLSADLEAFLEAGAPPVYVGFGSIALPSTREAARIAIEAARAQGRRVVLARGWVEAAPIDDGDDVFLTGDVNQQALFPRMAAVVHHGGAGTTTTATRSGAPQVIVPQIVDQPYWAARVAGLGVGVAHDGATPTLESLSRPSRSPWPRRPAPAPPPCPARSGPTGPGRRRGCCWMNSDRRTCHPGRRERRSGTLGWTNFALRKLRQQLSGRRVGTQRCSRPSPGQSRRDFR